MRTKPTWEEGLSELGRSVENRYRTEAREIRSEVSQWPENGRQGPWTEAVAVGIKIKGWAENHF